MERLNQWFQARLVGMAIVLVVLVALAASFTASWTRTVTEERCAGQLEKAVVLATEEAARATIGRPADMGDVYQTGDIIYCLASADTLDRAMGLFYRVIEDPMTARYVVWINDTDGEAGTSFQAGKLYLVKNDGDGVYPEVWTPPTTN